MMLRKEKGWRGGCFDHCCRRAALFFQGGGEAKDKGVIVGLSSWFLGVTAPGDRSGAPRRKAGGILIVSSLI